MVMIAFWNAFEFCVLQYVFCLKEMTNQKVVNLQVAVRQYPKLTDSWVLVEIQLAVC